MLFSGSFRCCWLLHIRCLIDKKLVLTARDIQAWEYVPLGPFLGKSFGKVMIFK